MELDERIDLEEFRFHPNKLAVLWSMADFIRTELEELITREKLEKSVGCQPTELNPDDLDF